jgi:hypothetical protein
MAGGLTVSAPLALDFQGFQLARRDILVAKFSHHAVTYPQAGGGTVLNWSN